MVDTRWSLLGGSITHSCPSCGKKNRIPPEHLTDVGKCGSCGKALPALDVPLDVDVETFDAIITKAKVPVLVDFWAAWCGPCRMAAPEVKRAASATTGQAIVLKVDTERYPELAMRYSIRSIPNFVVWNNGRVVMQRAGAVDHTVLEGWLAEAA
jgi:thioredoxin 2